jgi:hypothetical protein
MKKYLLISTLILVIASCVTPGKFAVTRIGEEPQIYSQRFIYSLPRTVVMINLNFEKDTYIPGPYRLYSEKFLGISEFINKAETKWRVSGANLSGFNEPDPLQYYSVNLITGSFPSLQLIELGKNGLILDSNQGIGIGAEGIVKDKIIEPPYFTNLSEKENFTETTDTLYKTIIKDTSFVKIPFLRKQREAKTLEQKAEEASNFIINLRERRYELQSGDSDVFPEGTTLETMISELNKLEKEYLTLFIGKIFTQRYSRSFFITPSGTVENITFMKLSAGKGILPADSPEGESVTIEISPLGSTGVLKKNLPQTPKKNEFNTFYFRLPEVSSLRLVQKDKLLYESRFTICQAGSLLSLPVGMQDHKLPLKPANRK